ncbi:Arginine--tRNA ligase [Candidatus Ornithobacterium hominis]|uniref:Arginine--tRNA ligase n=1 Tax=Candidatus Ornithobacterium hominis TaxID=2497989 RepID=A0A383TXC8_9FLAO|nr:arginine--tRNA ligase [Candidatus Ornithobacterium hominis]MCT7904774.1 arginine--tRNA ligase [Candidatus Ornithobacterium hominis]CAI9429168.1 arginine--tRNA ligase [Candidatus Ornithobacterium hominis]SZD71541.1 Arginine--tRNA ligase [Candidatus Ornithobacterium hominis]
MNIKTEISSKIFKALKNFLALEDDKIELQNTRKEFKGDYTLVVFPFVKILKLKPEEAAEKIGEKLLEIPEIKSYNVVKGFLNLSLTDEAFYNFLYQKTEEYPKPSKKIMVEYSSPNTNKPLHLGHVRNNLLGYSVAEILREAGNEVLKTQVINDRGIHICKSMLAWQKFGKNETPESSGKKGDHLVGDYYVKFDQEYQKEIQDLVAKGMSPEQAKKEAPLLNQAQKMLKDWEDEKPEVRELWAKMNAWVYNGFEETYQRLGVDFDSIQYESETYLLGKDIISKGLEKNVFYQKEDGSVWIDLTNDGLDEKLVLRSDGTSVYITQDLGTAVQRFESFNIDGLTYVVGNEQDYHFKVLFIILKKLGFHWAEDLHHLSYGMVDLPHGKMKSREGTVVDADDLMNEMKATAKEIAKEAGKLDGMSDDEKEKLYESIGMAALKYYILKVDPKKRILFDPKESIDFNGNTGPFLQYAYVRIQSVLRKKTPVAGEFRSPELTEIEKNLVKQMNDYDEVVSKAAEELNPALVANYAYDLVKLFNGFYQNHSILSNDDENITQFRLQLIKKVGEKIKRSLNLLGIKTPVKM